MASYVLIDSAQRPGFNQRLERLGIPYRSLFEGHPERNLPEIAPLLLVAPSADTVHGQTAGNTIAKLAAERPAVSHLSSDLGLLDLAAHLRAFHLVKLPANKHMIVRWYDTRVLPAWLGVLTPPQRTSFLMGISSWRYFDRFGEGQEIHVGDGYSAPDPRSKEPVSMPLELTQHQFAGLRRAAEVDALLFRLKEVLRDELKRVDARTLHEFVSTHLQVSRDHGLTTMKDYVQFALMALYTTGRCVEHPYVRAQRVATEVNALPPTDWLRKVPDDVLETGTPLWKQDA